MGPPNRARRRYPSPPVSPAHPPLGIGHRPLSATSSRRRCPPNRTQLSPPPAPVLLDDVRRPPPPSPPSVQVQGDHETNTGLVSGHEIDWDSIIVEERSSEEGRHDVTNEQALYIQLGLCTEDEAFIQREDDVSGSSHENTRNGDPRNHCEDEMRAAIPCSDLGDVGNDDEIGGFLKKMAKFDVPGLEKLMRDLVQFLSCRNRFDEALLVIQLHHASSGNIRLCQSPLVMVAVFACRLDLDLTLVQFDKMSKKICTPNSHTFKILKAAPCSHGRVDESVDLFDKMLQLRCILGRYFYVQVSGLILALITCFCENQLLDDAVTTFNEMIASGHAPMRSTFLHIADCYGTPDQSHKVVSFLEENDAAEMEAYNVLL
ncbi:hypothetical protein GUJ93_ZPchr0013g37519 [Zizania palustris]|uniref:Pentatricopeptide repeat-containing protein n=1 Tax=Zizania palustris TaxID=103762 RepID=A0A8J5X024_ZIZPA|nr:hypothetical protein GUJ93_ZPchr0013g37519 [Zizania palustris]